MHPYIYQNPSPEIREHLEQSLFGLDLLPAVQEALLKAWGSALQASPFEKLSDVPFSHSADYSLLSHINEVTETGVALAEKAATFWGEAPDPEILIPALILHDVDKPLMTVRVDGRVESSRWSRELPHGVLGSMIVKDAGFSHDVVSIVATHSSVAPFHGRGLEAYILHYADFFSADHAFIGAGKEPFYQRHWR